MTETEPLQRLLRADLNLLPVLLVLIETGSTQATADRIGRTQSAVSHALGRLRALFGDPLFIRHGPRLRPTPLTESLHGPLRRLMYDAGRVIDRGGAFDPASSERRIVLAAPDLALPLLQTVIARIRVEAPDVSLRLTGDASGFDRLADGRVDLLVSFYRTAAEPGLTSEVVGSSRWCVFVPPGLDFPATPDAADWGRIPHVQVHIGPDGRSPVDEAAALVGARRRVALQVSGFLEALHAARAFGFLFTNSRDLAGPMAEALHFSARPLPFEIPAAPVAILTRETRHDPFSRWLHGLAVAMAREYFHARRDR